MAATTQRWELYRLLSEPVRLRLLALTAEEELAIGELAELLHESQPNVSRHIAPLRQAGLVVVRKQGTRALAHLAERASTDPVVGDALASGRALCAADGSLRKVADVLAARDAASREFFARSAGDEEPLAAPDALGAYVAAMAMLLPRRELAIDAGTGDGGLLEVLAPAFERVVAVDRSETQLARARARVVARGFSNVKLVIGDLDSPSVQKHAGADVVFAARILHHAPKPAELVQRLARLCRCGGAVLVLDYARHDDESMRDLADIWLGFEPQELHRFARSAGLGDVHVTTIPTAWCGRGKDHRLPWQVMVAHRQKVENHHG